MTLPLAELPEHVRRVLTSLRVTRYLREHLSPGGAHAAVVALPGATLPEGLDFEVEALTLPVTGETVRIAVTSFTHALELARARVGERADEHVAAPLPASKAWCLALDRGRRLAFAAITVKAPARAASRASRAS